MTAQHRIGDLNVLVIGILILFAHDLWHRQIENLSNSIDLNRKDGAKRYHKSSIFNIQSRLVRIRHFF
jgi:hypothetical protein